MYIMPIHNPIAITESIVYIIFKISIMLIVGFKFLQIYSLIANKKSQNRSVSYMCKIFDKFVKLLLPFNPYLAKTKTFFGFFIRCDIGNTLNYILPALMLILIPCLRGVVAVHCNYKVITYIVITYYVRY